MPHSAKLLCLTTFLTFGLPSLFAAEELPQLERGRYLVEQVGLCADCHTPRNATGQFVKGKHLMGAPIDFTPNHPMPAWGAIAPRIAGLPSMSKAQAIRFLTSGEGRPVRPPMPAYRFSPSDAEAVVVYLKSLGKKTDH